MVVSTNLINFNFNQQQKQDQQQQQQQQQIKQRYNQQNEILPFPIIKNILDFYFNNEVHYRVSQLGRLSDRFVYHKLAPIAQLSHKYFDLVSERYVVRFVQQKPNTDLPIVDTHIQDIYRHLCSPYCFIKHIQSLECTSATFDHLLSCPQYVVLRDQLTNLSLLSQVMEQPDFFSLNSLRMLSTFQSITTLNLRNIAFTRELFEVLLRLPLKHLSIQSVVMVERLTEQESELLLAYLKCEQNKLESIDTADCIRLPEDYLPVVTLKPNIHTLTVSRVKNMIKFPEHIKTLRLNSCRNKFFKMNIGSHIQTLTLPSINAKHIDSLSDFIRESNCLTSLNVYLSYWDRTELSANCVEIWFGAFERIFVAINQSSTYDRMQFLFSAYPKFLKPQLERLFQMLSKIHCRCHSFVIDYYTNKTDYNQLLKDLETVNFEEYIYAGIIDPKGHQFIYNPNHQQQQQQQLQYQLNQLSI